MAGSQAEELWPNDVPRSRPAQPREKAQTHGSLKRRPGHAQSIHMRRVAHSPIAPGDWWRRSLSQFYNDPSGRAGTVTSLCVGSRRTVGAGCTRLPVADTPGRASGQRGSSASEIQPRPTASFPTRGDPGIPAAVLATVYVGHENMDHYVRKNETTCVGRPPQFPSQNATTNPVASMVLDTSRAES